MLVLEAAKSKNPFFAGSVSKKGQAKLAIFWSKGNENPLPPRPCDRRGAPRALVGRVTRCIGLRANAVRPCDNPKAALVFRLVSNPKSNR
jgi:hypothetical protein